MLMTIGQAAETLGLTRSKFYDETRQPGFPAPVDMGHGKPRRYRAAEIQAWAESQGAGK